MMLGGMERVPSDISNDLNSCNGEQVHIYIYTHTGRSTSVQFFCLNGASPNPTVTFICCFSRLACGDLHIRSQIWVSVLKSVTAS